MDRCDSLPLVDDRAQKRIWKMALGMCRHLHMCLHMCWLEKNGKNIWATCEHGSIPWWQRYTPSSQNIGQGKDEGFQFPDQLVCCAKWETHHSALLGKKKKKKKALLLSYMHRCCKTFFLPTTEGLCCLPWTAVLDSVLTAGFLSELSQARSSQQWILVFLHISSSHLSDGQVQGHHQAAALWIPKENLLLASSMDSPWDSHNPIYVHFHTVSSQASVDVSFFL